MKESETVLVYSCGKHKLYTVIPRNWGKCYCGNKMKLTQETRPEWNKVYGR